MIDSLERFVLLYDLQLRTARKATEFEGLETLAGALLQRVKDGKSHINLPSYEGDDFAPWMRLKSAKIVELSENHQGLALLFSIGDPRAANPCFEHQETAVLRTIEKEEKEGKAITAHGLISLLESGPKRYKMIVEDIRGLGRTRLREILGAEFKAISEDYGLEYTNNAGEQVGTYIIADLMGHKSEKIGDSLKRSTVSGIYLIDTKSKISLDEVDGADIARREIKVSISKNASDVIDDIKNWGASNGYDRMRLIWNDPEGAGKPERASVDTTEQDVKDSYFIKQSKIKLTTPLAEAVTEIRDDVIQAMYKQVK